MKFVPYIFKNMFRNKLRTTFTILSIAISLALVTLLYSYISFQDELGEKSKDYNRIIVTGVQGLTELLPSRYLDAVRPMQHVKEATALSWFGGTYEDDKIPFAQFAVEAETVFKVHDEQTIAPEQLQAWLDDKTSCVVGATLARNRGWKVNDVIRLRGAHYNCDLEMPIKGIFGGPKTSGHMESLFFHWDYMEEEIKKSRDPRVAGFHGLLAIKVDSASNLPGLMKDIDDKFANSSTRVRAMTEQAFGQMFTEMIGNVQAFIRNTALAVVFSLVCVAGNAMAMSLRERTREVAVLKAIGFRRGTVLALILGEAVLIALAGGAIGALGTKFGLVLVDPSRLLPGLGPFYVPWGTALFAIGLAAFIGFASGIIPAWRAAQMSVVDGLRKVV